MLLGLGWGAEFGDEPFGGNGVRPGEGRRDFDGGHIAIVTRLFVVYSPDELANFRRPISEIAVALNVAETVLVIAGFALRRLLCG